MTDGDRHYPKHAYEGMPFAMLLILGVFGGIICAGCVLACSGAWLVNR